MADKEIMVAKDKSEALPLSRAQLEIWLAQRVDPSHSKYNIAEYIEIGGCELARV